MSQTLSQRLGLHNAVPYVTAKQREHAASHARDAAAQRRQRIRAAVARRAAAVLDTVKHAWHISAPWVAALCLVVAIGAMQIADSQGARLAAVTAERDALRAVNQPGATLTLQAAHLPDLATTARKFATAIDADYIATPPGPRSKRVTP